MPTKDSSNCFRNMVRCHTHAYMHLSNPHFPVETTQILFQIRPWKEFLPQKGKDRILSLSLLSDLIPSTDIRMEEGSSHSGSSDIHARNAHDFMMSRRRDAEDPTTRRWKAEVRAANYTPLDSAPLCVSTAHSKMIWLLKESVDGFNWLTA